MANLQALPVADPLNEKQRKAESSLAIMQADIDKALEKKQKEKQQARTDPSSTVKSNESLSKVTDVADNTTLDAEQLSRVIEMAWEDRTPFAAIEYSYGLAEADVIILMRQELKRSSFRLWRQRVTGRSTKHQAKRPFMVGRAYCKTQYKQR
ncbi:uncharacterized protein (TIGR03643 family) [Psychrobacter sp. PL15]|nr:uncharacterized protein (TIGR03643 family) [Psychrobacter sp. PL15]